MTSTLINWMFPGCSITPMDVKYVGVGTINWYHKWHNIVINLGSISPKSETILLDSRKLVFKITGRVKSGIHLNS